MKCQATVINYQRLLAEVKAEGDGFKPMVVVLVGMIRKLLAATNRITICLRIGLLNTLNLSDFKDNVKNLKSKT